MCTVKLYGRSVSASAKRVDEPSRTRHKGEPPGRERLYAAERGVAQPGSALGSGPRSRRFKSSRPD